LGIVVGPRIDQVNQDNSMTGAGGKITFAVFRAKKTGRFLIGPVLGLAEKRRLPAAFLAPA
jgi:hypothetical protein